MNPYTNRKSLYCCIAKPVGNIAWHVCRKNKEKLLDLFESSSSLLTFDLCGKGLISKATRDQVLHPLGMSPADKAGLLLAAVERAIISDYNSKKPFMKLCSVLKKYEKMGHVERNLRRGKDVLVN